VRGVGILENKLKKKFWDVAVVIIVDLKEI
jgi:hypothetical protein